MGKVYVDDEAVKTIIEAVAEKAIEEEQLGLELGKVVVPTISLNKYELGEVKVSTAVNLGIAEVIVIPKDRVLLGIICNDTDFANLMVEVSIDDGITWRRTYVAGHQLVIQLNQTWLILPVKIKSDGVNLRLLANVTAVDGVQYMYEE